MFVGFVTNMRYVPEPLFLPGGFTIHHCLGLSASAWASWPRCWGSIRHSSKKSKWCLPNLTCIAWKLRQRQSLRVIWVKPANKMRAIKGDPCETWKRLQLNVWVALYERLWVVVTLSKRSLQHNLVLLSWHRLCRNLFWGNLTWLAL